MAITHHPPFGHPMREKYFAFAPTYKALNRISSSFFNFQFQDLLNHYFPIKPNFTKSSLTHPSDGSFGTHPIPVRTAQNDLQTAAIARPDTFISFTTFPLLAKSRALLSPLLGISPDELVLIPNATTGVNTVLRNLSFSPSDVIIAFSTIYPACEKTIASIAESQPVELEKVELWYPLEDEEILRLFREKVRSVRERGKNVKLVMCDTVLTFPGARFPWEEVVGTCREEGILSLVDGAHGIGEFV